jgi:NAD(P)-dependent dehydrogenase (short-subunit alcohol dehydrogenase family)
VIVHGRNAATVEPVVQSIARSTGNDRIDYFTADLFSLSQIQTLVDSIRQKYDRLDVLINNAGIATKKLQFSEDGYELTFAVNHLATFALTVPLLELLIGGAPSRIINVSSMVHSSSLDLDNLTQPEVYDGWEAYCQSKLCNVLFTYELADRLKDQGVTVNCMHPGVIGTKLLNVYFGGGSPASGGSQKLVYLASAPELSGITGKYFTDNRETRSAEITYDPGARKQLWRLSEKLCGMRSR